jgi:hypothetical protein
MLEVLWPGLVDEVLAEAGVEADRGRWITPRMAASITLALWMWRGEYYAAVLARLFNGLRWAGYFEVGTPAVASAVRAREVLGPESLRYLEQRLSGPGWYPAGSVGGLALRSLDTGPARRACPMLAHVLTLAIWRGAPLAASWALAAVSTAELAGRVLRPLTSSGSGGQRRVHQVCRQGGVAGLDRGRYARGGRAPPDAVLTGVEELGDGGYLAELQVFRVRFITPLRRGPLVTTLMDPQFAWDGELVVRLAGQTDGLPRQRARRGAGAASIGSRCAVG